MGDGGALEWRGNSNSDEVSIMVFHSYCSGTIAWDWLLIISSCILAYYNNQVRSQSELKLFLN